MALRRLPARGPGGAVAAGTKGEVVALGHGHLAIAWAGGQSLAVSDIGPTEAAGLGYGYATTVPYLRATGPGTGLMVLGNPRQLGPRLAQCKAAWLALPGTGLPSFGPGGPEGRLAAGLRHLSALDRVAALEARPPALEVTGRRRGPVLG